MRDDPLVLTYMPGFQKSIDDLAKQIQERRLPIYLSHVRGVVPDLHTRDGDYIRGFSKIREYINRQLKPEPPL